MLETSIMTRKTTFTLRTLKDLPLFASFANGHLEAIAGMAHGVSLKEKQVVCRQGERAGAMYVDFGGRSKDRGCG